MPTKAIRIIGAIPGAATLAPIVEEFARNGGIATSTSDRRLGAIASLLPEDSMVEVLPFGEVVTKFFAYCGKVAPRLPQRGHLHAAVAAACGQLLEGTPYGNVRGFPGFHRRLERTLAELRGWGLNAAELAGIAAKASPSLAPRLDAISRVEELVERTLADLGMASNSARIAECLELQPAEGVRLGNLLVVAGEEYEPVRAGWIRWAAERGARVTVVTERPAHEGQATFAASKRLCAALGGAPEPAGTPVALAGAIFTPHTSPSDAKVEIWSSADPLAEAEWAMRGCLADLDSGIPMSRIAIVVRDLDGYAPLIRFASSRLGLPIRISQRTPLLANAFVRVLLEAIEFAAGDDVRALRSILKSSYVCVEPSARLEIEGALRSSYCAGAGQWQALEGWAASRMGEHPWLAGLLKWRHQVLHENLTLDVWLDRIRSLADELEWHHNALGGPLATRERDVRAQTTLHRVLAQTATIEKARGKAPLSCGRFAAELRALWEQADTSLPMPPMGVSVTDSPESLGHVESLYVLGMLEGVFPRRRSEDPILSDRDRAEISSFIGAESLEDSQEGSRSERDNFYRICSAATKKLVLSYPETQDDRDNVPAFYLSEVDRALEGVVKVSHSRSALTPDPPFLCEEDARLAAALESPREEPASNQLETEEGRELARSPAEGPYAPHQLREVLECPFRYLAAHRLELRRHGRRIPWAALRKLPEEAQLARAESPEAARSRLEAALETIVESLRGETEEHELCLLRAGAARLIDGWVRREFLARQIWPRTGLSVFASFGEPPLRPELPLGGRKLKLRGAVGATATIGEYTVAMTTERWHVDGDRYQSEPEDDDKLEMGLWLLSMYGSNRAVGIEVESLRGERTLFVVPRLTSTELTSRTQDKLTVHDLGEPETFFELVKARAKEAIRRTTAPEVVATPGMHCTWCEFGELCRRHLEYSEELSPFDRDDQ